MYLIQKEVYSGVQYTVKASFRAYNNWVESISDHTKLLISLKRYSNIIGEKNYVQACKKYSRTDMPQTHIMHQNL